MNLETQRINPAPIRKSFRVKVPQEKAFRVFMNGMGRWWPKDYSLLGSPQTDVVVEPRAGGRWYEIGEDGSEYQWGRVALWEEPHRAILIWQLSGDWRFEPDFETEVEIVFRAEGDGTLVEFEHRGLEAYARTGRDGQLMEMDQGWGAILNRFVEEAEREG